MESIAKETVTASLRVVMFPWLAYSHTSQFLELAKKLTERGIYIYFCSTPINLASISKRITDKYSNSIELVEIHLPKSPELPPDYQTTNGLPENLQIKLRKAFKMSQPQLENIIDSLKPDFLIYDAVAHLFSIIPPDNIPSILFNTTSMATFSYTSHFVFNPGHEYPFPNIYYRDFEIVKVSAVNEGFSPNKMLCQLPAGPVLVNTSRWIEGKYMDHSANNLNRKILPVGPLVQYPVAAPEGEEQQQDIDLIQWLAQKKEHSAVFASFGSEYFLTKEEIEEIASGLELSDNVNFIWALRLPKGEENRVQLEQILPEGFLERVRDRGRVIRGWAPQALILGHSSIGGFISHCGWGSVLEAIEFGVPILAMPMNYEQPLNARLMVENGVAVEVMRDEKGILRREEIAQVIKNVVIGNGGDHMRSKIKHLRENMKSSQEEGLDEVVKMLAQLSEKSADSDAITSATAKLV